MTAADGGPTAAERLAWLQRTMTTWLLAVVLLVIAGVVAASFTLGLFSSSSANPHNVVTSGSMSQVNSADNAAIMGATDMIPGDEVDGRVTIRNAGDARGDFRMKVEDVDDVPGPGGGLLSERLRLRVTDVGSGEVEYLGVLGAFDADLGSWAPEEERTFEFRVTFPSTTTAADNAYQRSDVTATFVWNAVQSR